jgi:hypothetical protein
MMDISCATSAILFILSNILSIVSLKKYQNRSNFDYEAFNELDPTHIQEEWEYRNEHRNLELSAGVINAVAWFSLLIPMLQVVWVQSVSGTRQLALHVTVVVLAFGAATTELIGRVLYTGSTNAAQWLAKDFNLDNWLSEDSNDEIGWRTLEMIHVVVRGMLLWIDALEWLALFGISMLLFVSIQTQKDHLLGRRWALFGVILGLFSIVDFAADVLRLESWRSFSEIAFVTTAINRVILIPGWLFWLGYQLPQAKALARKQSTTVAEGMQASSVVVAKDATEEQTESATLT